MPYGRRGGLQASDAEGCLGREWWDQARADRHFGPERGFVLAVKGRVEGVNWLIMSGLRLIWILQTGVGGCGIVYM